jgi:hypothetical protein
MAIRMSNSPTNIGGVDELNQSLGLGDYNKKTSFTVDDPNKIQPDEEKNPVDGSQDVSKELRDHINASILQHTRGSVKLMHLESTVRNMLELVSIDQNKNLNVSGLVVEGAASVNGVFKVTDDTDSITYLGRTAVGTDQYSDHACISHRDLVGDVGQYALLQSSDGSTSLNCASNKSIYLKVNNSAYFTMNSTGGITLTGSEGSVWGGWNCPIYLEKSSQASIFYCDPSNSYRGWMIGFHGTNDILYIGKLTSKTAGSYVLQIGSSGSIGIGTSPSSHKLNVNGSLNVGEVYTSGWFRVSGTSGLYNQTYSMGCRSCGGVASYGNMVTYGSGVNGYKGWSIDNICCWMSNGSTHGLHDHTNGWAFCWVGTSLLMPWLYGYNQTSISYAQVRTATNGWLVYYTSSKEAKKDIEDIEKSKYTNIIDRLRPVWFRAKDVPENAGVDPNWSYYGLIAEEVYDIDPRLTTIGKKDKNGVYRPSGVDYEKVGVLLLCDYRDTKKDVYRRLEALEKKVGISA